MTTKCECGAVFGEACATASNTVTVEWMPEYLRSSHSAAGNAGRYPHNGSVRLSVSPECAARIVESAGKWASVV